MDTDSDGSLAEESRNYATRDGNKLVRYRECVEEAEYDTLLFQLHGIEAIAGRDREWTELRREPAGLRSPPQSG
jgi:hypothetical protein